MRVTDPSSGFRCAERTIHARCLHCGPLTISLPTGSQPEWDHEGSLRNSRQVALARLLDGWLGSLFLSLMPPLVRSASTPPAGCAPRVRKWLGGVTSRVPVHPEVEHCQNGPADGQEKVLSENPACRGQACPQYCDGQVQPRTRSSTRATTRLRRLVRRTPFLLRHKSIVAHGRLWHRLRARNSPVRASSLVTPKCRSGLVLHLDSRAEFRPHLRRQGLASGHELLLGRSLSAAELPLVRPIADS